RPAPRARGGDDPPRRFRTNRRSVLGSATTDFVPPAAIGRGFRMKITWFGHSAFRLEFGEAVVLIDPFLSGNPSFTGDAVAASAGATHIVLTHGHGDHLGDTVAIAERTGAKLVATFELCQFLAARGVKATDPMNT